MNAYEYKNNLKGTLGMGTDPNQQRQSQSTDYDFRKKGLNNKFQQLSAKPANEAVQKTENQVVKNRDSQGSSSSNKMQKIQLSVNKNNEGLEAAGSISHKSNNSFRLADNLFEIDQQQFN